MNWKCLSLQAALTIDGQPDPCSVLTLKLALHKVQSTGEVAAVTDLKALKN